MYKGFWFKFSFFSLGMAAIFFLVSARFDPFFETRLTKSKLFPKIMEERPFEFLVLGDSHAEKFRDTASLEGAFFNFAEGSDNYKNMLVKLGYVIRNKKFKTLILEVGEHSFSLYRSGQSNVLQAMRFSDYATARDLFDLNFLEFLKNKFSYYFPLTYQGNLQIFRRKFFKDLTLSSLSSGEVKKISKMKYNDYWEKLSPEERRRDSKLRAKEHYSEPYVKSTETIFLKIIELCKQNGIEIIFIKYPVAKEYLDFKSQYSLHQAKELLARFPEYPIMDYSNWNSDNPKLFKNCDHLNQRGAIMFSKQLVADLNRH